MTGTREKFWRAGSAQELGSRAERAAFYIWNLAVLLLSSFALDLSSLSLAFGTYDWALFMRYLRVPEVILLNWIPILLFQLLMLCLTRRHYRAFLISALFFIIPSLGNFYKIKLRTEPFTVRDLSSIGEAFNIAGNYKLGLNKRIVLVFAVCAVLFVFLLFFAKARPGRKFRIFASLTALLSLFPLWRFVYSDSEIYLATAKKTGYLEGITDPEIFIQNGFVYPFLFGISTCGDKPAGYDAGEVQALLSEFEDEAIPEDKRVNIMVVQLESFFDLERAGLSGISSYAYEVYHRLSQESICGTLVANVYGGGTINTERCFLCGTCSLQNYYSDAPSYVRYLSSQGYYSTGGHVNRSTYYNRLNTNRRLGFDEYHFSDGYYENLMKDEDDPDKILMEDACQSFIELIAQGRPVFSFNVSISGHASYGGERLKCAAPFWEDNNVSAQTYNIVNNYLFSIYKTQRYLSDMVERLSRLPDPVVLLVYGDHPGFLDNTLVYDECGIDVFSATEAGLMCRYSTPYLIWANPAAKAVTGNDFVGQGPTVSPGYLMNVLFDALGWKGSAFMQFTSGIMERLPMVNTNGFYIEDGVFTRTLSPEGASLLNAYEYAQYWLMESFG